MLSVPDHLQTSRQQSLQGLFFSPFKEWFTNARRSRNSIKISHRPNLTRALRIMGPMYFRVQSPLGQLTKQTWRMTGKISAEQQFNWSRPIQLEDTEISMNLIERVQRELSSEERCIQISFYPYILVNLGLQLALQLDVFTTSWYVHSYTSC